MFGLELSFWLRFALLISILLLLMVFFDLLIRKWLKVEKRNFIFKGNYVNKRHEKIDWYIRWSTVGVMLFGFILNSTIYIENPQWYLQPWLFLFLNIILTETVRAVMERKYAENPKAYLATTSQIILIMIIFFTLIQTDFWGLM